MGNSLYTAQGAIPKAGSRKRNDVSSRFDKRLGRDGHHKPDHEQPVPKKATDIIESWTWGNQPGECNRCVRICVSNLFH